MRRFTIIAFVFCLVMSYIAETFFGVADITGAFIAGLIISNSQKNEYIASKFDTLSYMFLSPVFFASVGLQVELPNMSHRILVFALILVIISCLTKIVGCALGAKFCKYTTKESLQVGIGMISRGEVALIVASKGNSVGLMSPNFLGPIVVVVVFTTIVAPVLLKLSFKSDNNESAKKDDSYTKPCEKLLDYQRNYDIEERKAINE